MTRLQPTTSTIKKLFAFSGNQCAAPKCNNKLIEDNVILGEICHIEAAEENGPRYNPVSTDEYRRSYENLLLLCEKCHKKVDAKENLARFPSKALALWKSKHEELFIKNVFTVSDDLARTAIEEFMRQDNEVWGSGTQFNNQAEIQNIETQIGTQINNYTNQEKFEIEGHRKINDKFKKIIDQFRTSASPPKMAVIDFRNELFEGKERPIELVPLKYLKFRKDNGRIRAEIETIEKNLGQELDEYSEETQNCLRDLLKSLSPEDNNELKKLIKHKGQKEPAIITCDGFLINGNRRKLVLEELYSENNQASQYEFMRVVILPDHVTELDIQKVENRYQLQSEGKSEYHGLNRALTYRKNIEKGFTLEAQLKDDPNFVDLEGKDFARAIQKIRKDFLLPLDCVDRYLETFDRTGLYNTISEGAGDREGRWQAFVDYSGFYYSVLTDPMQRQKLAIKESEIGLIEDAIFKIIRKRDLDSDVKNFGKLHAFVRSSNLKKYLGNTEAKKHFFVIAKKVKNDLPEKEKLDSHSNRYDEREIDKIWGNKHRKEILGSLIQAQKIISKQDERDKPLELLEDALKKLQHKNLKIDNMGIEHYKEALKLAKAIKEKSEEIYQEVDHARYKLQKFSKKGKEY